MDIVWHRCNIHYYLREKLYGKVRKVLKREAVHVANTPEFQFYGGISHILEGQVQKGVVDLTPLQSDKEILLATLIALVFGHKISSTLEKETLYSLEIKLKEERKQANAISLYYAGLFLSLAGKYDKASEYINKALKKDPNNVDTLILKGWNDMYMSTEPQIMTLDCLELALNKSNKNPGALLGLAKLRYIAKEHDNSNLTLDKLIVNGPGQIVPLIEKLRNEFALQKWESVYDIMERIFIQEPDNIEALRVRIFLALCKHADNIEAADQLNRFYMVLENEETYNGYLFYNTAQIFSRVCGKSSTILSQAYRFAQYASEMYPSNIDYLSEVGYQCILQGKHKDAQSFFKAASKIDSNSITALCGLTLCQMADSGPIEHVSQQVELLFEMQGTKKMPILCLISAKLNEKVASNALPFLNDAVEIKLAHASRFPYSLNYIQELDPDFLLDVYKEFKKHLPKKPSIVIGYLPYTQDGSNSSLFKCFHVLETVCKACPGFIAGLYEFAKLKFLFGFPNEALKLAHQIGELDNTHAGCQILLAQMYIQQEAYTKASQALETCLSYNFKIKDSAVYNFLQGIIKKSSNHIQEALSCFTTSLSILNNKSNSNANRAFDSELNIIDRATLYLQIIELQTSLGLSDVGITMQEAIQEFSFTTEESRLLIAKADQALKRGDVDAAIEMLDEIKPGQPYYFQAHTKMAHIYLKQKNDTNMFTNCFKDVVSNHPMADAHTLMGDAYMSIHEPSRAAESYETALKGNMKNTQLIKKLGIALIKTHEYDKALQYYENAIKTTNEEELKFDYVDILVRLKLYDKADTYLSEELDQPHNKEKEIATMKRRVKLLQKQAIVRELQTPLAGNTSLILTEAKELQTYVVKRIEIETRGDISDEKQLLSELLRHLANVKSVKEPAVAANLYSEALMYTPRDPETLLALAKLYAQMNNADKCEQTLAVLLNTDPNNEAAAVMMADLAFRKVDLETAQRHLNQILSVKPTSWEALAQLVEVQWRRGRMEEVEQALDTAKQAMGDDEEPGYKYCMGVYSALSGRTTVALRYLNACRRSSVWGSRAARRMTLLCLSQQSADEKGDALFANGDEGDTRQLALRTAEKLLLEVPPSERRALQALLSVATKQKSQAERVLQELLPLVTDEQHQDDPYLILAIATAYNTIKQPTRAKNILKRSIASIPWTPEKAEGLERCWLEVADNQINSGRTDAAKELLTKILNHNNSCATAYQYQGVLAEKEQNYKSAAVNYDQAWSHTGKTNLSVGYKLAHAYLKLKKYPECIVVCRSILKIHPDYPKIRKEIFEKAKNNLRT